MFKAKAKHRFMPGHGTALAFGAMCGITALIFYLALKRENKRRDNLYGPPPGPGEYEDMDSEAYKRKYGLEGMTRDQIVELGDDHPAFRYIL